MQYLAHGFEVKKDPTLQRAQAGGSKKRLDNGFPLYYGDYMAAQIIKVSNARGQTIVGIPKALAIAAGLDKMEYAEVWLTEERIIHIVGLRQDDKKEGRVQGD